MDKWTNPLPILAAVDVVTLVLIAFYVHWIRQK